MNNKKMPKGTLFNIDEHYTELAHELSKDVRKFADRLFKKYPHSPTRDVAYIVNTILDYQAVFTRADRYLVKLKKTKRKCAAKKRAR
jgi:hypothetical protein